MSTAISIQVTPSDIVLCHQHSQFCLHITSDGYNQSQIVCHFLVENNKDLFAFVAAPASAKEQLAKRIVSFLSAYWRVKDHLLLEAELLRSIQSLK